MTLPEPQRGAVMNGRGEWYCNGPDGCGAKLESTSLHQHWHDKLDRELAGLRLIVENISTGALDYLHVHHGDETTPYRPRGSDGQDSARADPPANDLGEGAAVPLGGLVPARD